jgi:hypothetical protein
MTSWSQEEEVPEIDRSLMQEKLIEMLVVATSHLKRNLLGAKDLKAI